MQTLNPQNEMSEYLGLYVIVSTLPRNTKFQLQAKRLGTNFVCKQKETSLWLSQTRKEKTIILFLKVLILLNILLPALACNRFLPTNFSIMAALSFNVSFKLKCFLHAKDYGKIYMPAIFFAMVDSDFVISDL